MKTVPFLDLKAQYAAIRHEIRLSMDEVLNSASFVGGPIVENFEKEFADFCGCGYAASTSSGTSALWMTLLSLGIGQGDEVVTVPNTFIATAEAITFSGARPVFVDVEERSYHNESRTVGEGNHPEDESRNSRPPVRATG